MKIITLTLSPAIDIEYHIPRICPDGLNRTTAHTVTAGGKGINVSRSISRCISSCSVTRAGQSEPVKLVTVAPVGGAMGRLLCDLLAQEGLALTAVEIAGNTRTNVSLIADKPLTADEPLTSGEQSGGEIEINAPGTPVGEQLAGIEETVLAAVGDGDVVVIAGSCPADVPKSYPAELCAKLKAKGAVCVLDCDGEALKIAVESSTPPDLIKPNDKELAGLVGRPLQTRQEIAQAAEALAVPTVITTMAGDGAILTREVNEYRASTFIPTEKRPVVRLKGAGDTFLGAFVWAKYAAGKGDIEAMDFAGKVAGDYVAGE